jgi:hypothetical protein
MYLQRSQIKVEYQKVFHQMHARGVMEGMFIFADFEGFM